MAFAFLSVSVCMLADLQIVREAVQGDALDKCGFRT
jgi:hypothetical protein